MILQNKYIVKVLFCLTTICYFHKSYANEDMLGLNIINPQWALETTWKPILENLKQAGIRSIRVPLAKPYIKSQKFIEYAYNYGINVLIFIPIGEKGSEYNESLPRKGDSNTWEIYPISKIDVKKYKSNFQSFIINIELNGIILKGVEVGNEINWAPFNGDMRINGARNIITSGDLSRDYYANIRKSFDHYILLVRAIKSVLDKSKINNKVPIISSGLADINDKKWLSKTGYEYIDAESTLHYLRKKGLDKIVDFYGIHVYPNKNLPWNEQLKNNWEYILGNCSVGMGKKCWITEWGYPSDEDGCTVSDAKRSLYITKSLDYMSELENVSRAVRAYYFAWEPGPDQYSGLAYRQSLFRCGQLTPAGKAFLLAK